MKTDNTDSAPKRGESKKHLIRWDVYFVCILISMHIYMIENVSVLGWKGVWRRVSQMRQGVMMLVETEMQKLQPPMMTQPSLNRTLTPSQSPPPNWACAARSAPPPAAASATSAQSDECRALWPLQCLCHANRYVLTSLLCCSQERRIRTAGWLTHSRT